MALVHLAHVDVVEGGRVTLHVLGRRQDGRVPPLVQGCSTGVVERQAQAEADAGLDLAHALQDLLGGEQVDAPQLVVLAPVAPRRARRTLHPPLRHGPFFFRRRPSTGRLSTLPVPTGWSNLAGEGQTSRAQPLSFTNGTSSPAQEG